MEQFPKQESIGGWLKDNHREISSVFSDLEMTAGIPYDSARDKIKETDFPAIKALFDEYEAIDKKTDFNNGGKEQKATLQKISDLLTEISKRG